MSVHPTGSVESRRSSQRGRHVGRHSHEQIQPAAGALAMSGAAVLSIVPLLVFYGTLLYMVSMEI